MLPTHFIHFLPTIRNYRDLSGSTICIANAYCNANTKLSTLSNMCAVITRPFACSWMLENRPLQFGQSVDIDIDNQTSIQPQCIYISQDVRVALPSVSTLYNGKTLHLSARVHCIAWNSCKNHYPTCTLGTYSCHIKENETLHIYVAWKKRKIIMRCHHGPSEIHFVFISDSVISKIITSIILQKIAIADKTHYENINLPE